MRIRRITFLSLLLLVCSMASAETKVIADIEYAKPDGHSLKLDLYLPGDSNEARPAIVFVHGGGWKNGSKKSAKRNASWLAEHGFVVAGINYRLTQVAGWPAQIDDCYTAVRWLRANAGKYNIDSENIGAFGTSAGAHLVALMGTRKYPGKEGESSRVKAVCDWFGPSDLLSMPPNNIGNGRTAEDVANSNGAKLLRATVREVPKLAKDASAYFNVSFDDAAFLIMHGDQDKGVPLEQSQKLHAALTKAKVSSKLHVIKGAGHGGKLFHTPKAHQMVVDFFTSKLKKK
ncbi:MAG: lipase [Planctomycetaceae bacterium]|nr:lipase [Planctomycetaceae bacterium]